MKKPRSEKHRCEHLGRWGGAVERSPQPCGTPQWSRWMFPGGTGACGGHPMLGQFEQQRGAVMD